MLGSWRMMEHSCPALFGLSFGLSRASVGGSVLGGFLLDLIFFWIPAAVHPFGSAVRRWGRRLQQFLCC
ncbi:hypothetical protein ACFX2B_001797 [Malus domestica]